MSPVKLSFSVRMIKQVVDEWKAENPGKKADDMPSAEYARRILAKIEVAARTAP